MADTKISDMGFASNVANDDVVPLVKDGSNFKARRYDLLSAGAGENIDVLSSAGFAVRLLLATAGNELAFNDGDQTFFLRALGSVEIVSEGPLTLTTNGGDSAIVTYVCPFLSPGDVWAGTAPPDMAEAIDRISEALATLLGSPIP